MDKKNHLRLVTSKKVQTENTSEHLAHEETEYVLSDRTKIVILFFIMGVIPLSAYQFGADTWGREVGTHIAVGVGAICTLVTSLLIYILGWMDDIDEVQTS